MLCCASKPKDEEEEEKNASVYHPDKIYFDEYGNLRYDDKADYFDRKKDLARILQLDPGDMKADGLTWYLMDAPWVESWLLYAHVSSTAPRPNKCDNSRLIEWDDENNRWRAKKYLMAANDIRGGDYRRVTKETWETFATLFPGSGPAITMVFTFDSKRHASGFYDTDEFVILDPPPNPSVKGANKTMFSRLFKGSDKDKAARTASTDQVKNDAANVVENDDNTSIANGTNFNPILASSPAGITEIQQAADSDDDDAPVKNQQLSSEQKENDNDNNDENSSKFPSDSRTSSVVVSVRGESNDVKFQMSTFKKN